MPEPKIEVLGVYTLPVTQELIEYTLEVHWGEDVPERDRPRLLRECQEELESVVLIELLIRNPAEDFDPGDIVQPKDNEPPGSWQVPWDEGFLTPDGNALAVERGDAPPSGDLRMAFYIHFWDPDIPLHTPYGDILCPRPQPMPPRLVDLMPFEPVD